MAENAIPAAANPAIPEVVQQFLIALQEQQKSAGSDQAASPKTDWKLWGMTSGQIATYILLGVITLGPKLEEARQQVVSTLEAQKTALPVISAAVTSMDKTAAEIRDLTKAMNRRLDGLEKTVAKNRPGETQEIEQ